MGRGWLVVPVVLTAVLTGVLAASQLMQARTNPPNIDVNILIDRLIPEDFDFTKLSERDMRAIAGCIREMAQRWEAAGYANTTKDPPTRRSNLRIWSAYRSMGMSRQVRKL